jgi:hypothetical protein
MLEARPSGSASSPEGPKNFSANFSLQQHGACCARDAHARSKRRSGMVEAPLIGTTAKSAFAVVPSIISYTINHNINAYDTIQRSVIS